MTPIRKAVLAVAMVGSTLVGGGIGAALFAGAPANAAATQTTTPSTGSSSSSGAAVTPNGTFHSNEDTTHEAGESAAREAQETAGQMPTIP